MFSDNFSLGGIALGTIVAVARLAPGPGAGAGGDAGGAAREGAAPRPRRRRFGHVHRRRARTPDPSSLDEVEAARRVLARTRGTLTGETRSRSPTPAPAPSTRRSRSSRGGCGRQGARRRPVPAPAAVHAAGRTGHLVDINRLPGLDTVEATGDGVRVGALARHAQLRRDDAAARVQPLLGRARRTSPTRRSATAAPRSAASRTPTRRVRCRGPRPARGSVEGGEPGRRRTRRRPTSSPARSRPRCRPGELVVAAFFPASPPAAARPSSRSPGGTATTRCAGSARSSRWTTTACRRGPGGVRLGGPAPAGLDLTEPSRGSTATPTGPQAAPGRDADRPRGDIHATADYRRHLAGVLTAGPAAAAVRGPRRLRERAPRGPRVRARTITVGSTVFRLARSTVPARRLLSDALRHDLGLTGTHVGCEHGVCGACTVLLDGGRSARACCSRSRRRARVTTVEGLRGRRPDGTLHPVQQAFRDATGCSAASAPPASSPRSPPTCEDPDPTDRGRVEAIVRQPVPLHGLPEHRARRCCAPPSLTATGDAGRP